MCLSVLRQRSLLAQLSGGEEDFSSREAQLLVGVLAVLSCRLEPGSPQVSKQFNCLWSHHRPLSYSCVNSTPTPYICSQLDQMITWTLKICKETSYGKFTHQNFIKSYQKNHLKCLSISVQYCAPVSSCNSTEECWCWLCKLKLCSPPQRMWLWLRECCLCSSPCWPCRGAL